MIATGKQYSVRQFIQWSANELGFELEFTGNGIDEKGIIKKISNKDLKNLKVGDIIVEVDSRYFRPAEVETLLGDPSNAKIKLGWKPEITVKEMCAEMIREDLKLSKKTQLLKKHGYEAPIANDLL